MVWKGEMGAQVCDADAVGQPDVSWIASALSSLSLSQSNTVAVSMGSGLGMVKLLVAVEGC